MLLLLVGCAVPLWLSSYATELWQFLFLGLALGLVGASFSVGTPYVARFFPKGAARIRDGFFGAGTTGAAINMFIAPFLIARYGWQSVPKFYAVALLSHRGRCSGSCRRQIPVRAQGSVLNEAATSGASGPARLEILPILFDSVRRLHGAVGLDAAIFRDRSMAFGIAQAVTFGCLLFAARRRVSRSRRMACLIVSARTM